MYYDKCWVLDAWVVPSPPLPCCSLLTPYSKKPFQRERIFGLSWATISAPPNK